MSNHDDLFRKVADKLEIISTIHAFRFADDACSMRIHILVSCASVEIRGLHKLLEVAISFSLILVHVSHK